MAARVWWVTAEKTGESGVPKKPTHNHRCLSMPPLVPRRALLAATAATLPAWSVPQPAVASVPLPVAAARSVVAVVGGGPASRRTPADTASTPGGTGIAVGPSTVLTTSTIAAAAAASRGGVAILSLDDRGVTVARAARVVATDPRAGIALIAVEVGGEAGSASLPPLTPATFAPTSSLRVGQAVCAVAASPLDGAPALAAGLVSGLGRGLPLAGGAGALVGALQTDARLVEGGPLLDAGGAVVGLGVAPHLLGSGPPASVLGFALPSDAVVAAVSQVRVPV